jgi:hypothetical protein
MACAGFRKSSTGVADPQDMKRGISCPRRKVQQIPGCPILRAFCEGWDTTNLIPTVAYPTLCKERKGWGTRLFVVLPAVPNTNRGLAENLFLSESHMKLAEPIKFDRKSEGAQWRDLRFLSPRTRQTYDTTVVTDRK